jgi:MATE family multidrug resistance protein
LVTGRWGGEALGVLGCGISNAVVGWFSMLCAVGYMHFGAPFKPYRLFAGWQTPRCRPVRELLRLGMPMGFANLVEISSFTLMALFVAPLGATAVAGHRIVANLAAICYMLPLALGIATLARVGHAVGARDWRRAEGAIAAGMLLAGALSALLGLLLWLAAAPLIALYTDNAAVRAVSLALIGYVALYQIFDAVQTVATHALRGYRITFIPMLVAVLCFWGVGLYGGWWLAFKADPPLGVGGFWLASLLSLVLASLLLGTLLRRALAAVDR